MENTAKEMMVGSKVESESAIEKSKLKKKMKRSSWKESLMVRLQTLTSK